MSSTTFRPVILSRNASFLITGPGGDIAGADQGFYHRDRRLLSRQRLTIGGKRPLPLSGRAIEADFAQYFLLAPALAGAERGTLVVERGIRLGVGRFDEEISVHNYGSREAEVPVELRLAADFSHIFGVKRRVLQGRAAEQAGAEGDSITGGPQEFWIAPPRDRPDAGRVLLRFEPRPRVADGKRGRFSFVLRVPAEGAAGIRLLCDARGPAAEACAPRRTVAPPPPPPQVRARGELGGALTQAYARAMRDLYALAIRGRTIGLTDGDEGVAYAAGIPWYIALFGRDALLTSRLTMHSAPALAAGSLRALARLQGTRHEPETGEEPGKILHEFRPLTVPDDPHVIPRFPYYGSVDATPLFLMALSEIERATGSTELGRELWPAALAALGWMDGPGDPDGDGYLEYRRHGRLGLRNQGWKDSFDAIHFRDKRLAQPPIALVEVQGYQYAARRSMARMLRARGEREAARLQDRRAAELRENFQRDFWMARRDFFALGLDRRKRMIDVLASNGAQVLFTGIAGEEQAAKVADAVLREPFWTGFGIRTLAEGEGRYNPVSYHNGSVWPHDNALIAEGLLQAGRGDGAMMVARAMLLASRQRGDRRLPELYAGFGAGESPEPVPYPSACPVQAWSAGALPHLVVLMLGLDVRNGRATIDPRLPEGVDQLEVEGLWVLGSRVSARIFRDRAGRPTARTGSSEGVELHVRRRVRR